MLVAFMVYIAANYSHLVRQGVQLLSAGW